MTNSMPNALPNGKGIITKAGNGPEPGGSRYLDMVTGNHTTVYEALVITTGGRFSLVAVKGNQVLNKVRVEHDVVFGGERVAVGDTLLVGAIRMTELGAEATKAWPFRSNGCAHNGHRGGNPAFSPPPPRPVRGTGTVTRVHPSGRFCEILEDRSGHRYFAHQSQFRLDRGARMAPGFRVTFCSATTPRGQAAMDIQPQN